MSASVRIAIRDGLLTGLLVGAIGLAVVVLATAWETAENCGKDRIATRTGPGAPLMAALVCPGEFTEVHQPDGSELRRPDQEVIDV